MRCCGNLIIHSAIRSAPKTIPLDDEQNSAELRFRLLRESQAGGKLSQPNIVVVYDVSEQDKTAYIVMEYAAGRTLDQAIASDPPVRWVGGALRIVQQCGNALDYAHSRGVVHRDIRPANIMLQADGSVKIANFGITKAAQFTPPDAEFRPHEFAALHGARTVERGGGDGQDRSVRTGSRNLRPADRAPAV